MPPAIKANTVQALPVPLTCLAIGAAETVIAPCADAAPRFSRQRGILLEDAIDRSFLTLLLALVERATFVSDTVPLLGHRGIESPPLAGAAISLALKRPNLLRWIETVTGCGPLGSVEGRIVQTQPVADDALAWHDDRDRPRALAVTIGLTTTPYRGGAFELREKAGRSLLLRHHHITPGQMLLFDVADDIEHRVPPLESGGPRRVYTGWFLADAR